MGTFCEAFGITKIEAPSIARKRIRKKRTQAKFKRPPRKPKPFVKNSSPSLHPKRNNPTKRKRPLFATNVAK